MAVQASVPSVISLAPNTNFTPDAMTGQVDVVTLKETGYGTRRKAVFRFRDWVTSVVDNAGVGGQVCNLLANFPVGSINFEGAVVDLTVARFTGTVAGLQDTWTGSVGLGSATGVAPALAGVTQDLVATTPIAAAVSGLASAQASAATVPAVPAVAGAPRAIDNSAGTLQAFLNILVAQASRDGSAVKVKINGTVTIHYTYLGNKAAVIV